MNIRLATVVDVPALARIHVDAWQAAYRGVVPDSFLEQSTVSKREASFREFLLKDSAEATYVAEESGEVVGFLTVGPCRDADVDENRTGEIWGIYIAPRHWRKGIGKRLAAKAQETLKCRGYTEATLWVSEQNKQARRFYEALDFRPDSAAKELNYGKPVKAIRYRKSLTSIEGGPGGRSWTGYLLWSLLRTVWRARPDSSTSRCPERVDEQRGVRALGQRASWL